ncbi:MAG: translation initiation factor IF-2 subunit gamma [Desulfurococcaceae archaeon]|jgi:translation initiation factor 2 subunit 3|nr:translation initiation factor IF-2 subunit gamma [Desulfurococcaceae archaeon]
MRVKIQQPEVNIGVVGHVDHGKTTLVQALTGIWTARHSMEIERGMTIFLGYADGNIAYCEDLSPPESYTTELTCPSGLEAKLLRRVSYVDAPGHEAYMTTMLSGAMVVDGAILVIAANEPCPQPQTIEHLMALEILGVKNIIIVQNKVDVVSREKALKNYEEIKKFVQGTIAEDAPIIPVSALHKVNIDVVVEALYKLIPLPQRNLEAPPVMYVLRSFDINRPGTRYSEIQGGVIGGTIIHGVFRVGDEVKILPGIKKPGESGKTSHLFTPVVTRIEEMRFGEYQVDEAKPGGLVAFRTTLDPSLTKANQLAGSIVVKADYELPVVRSIEISYNALSRVVDVRGQPAKLPPLQVGEKVVVAVGPATRIATVKSTRKDRVELNLEMPVATWRGARVAIGRRVIARWRLAGWGFIEELYE